jgi:hypothetical protein
MAAMFALLFAADQWVTGGRAFASVAPNPLWLPVLAFAMAYGTGAGVVAAALAGAYWLHGAGATVTDADYLDRLLHLSLPPLMWFVGAGVVGEVTLARGRRAGWLRRRVEAGQRDLRRLGAQVDDLLRANRALQVRLATGAGASGRIVALASGLGARDPAARRDAICALIAEAAGTSDFTCYLPAADGGARAWLRGAAAGARAEALAEPLVGIIRKRAGLLHVGRRADRVPLQGVGVAAVPLRAAGSGEMIGVLVLHDLPFAALDTFGLAALAEIGDWLAPLLGEAPRVARGGVELVA